MRRPIYNFAIDPELLQALREVKTRDGISESEQIRRALRDWFSKKRVGMYAQKAAWVQWMDSVHGATDKVSVRVPVEVSADLGGRALGDLSKKEEARLVNIATSLGFGPDLSVLLNAIIVGRLRGKRSRRA